MRIFSILLLLSIVYFVDAHKNKPRKAKNKWDHQVEYLPDLDSQWCKIIYKAKVLAYPDDCSQSFCSGFFWWSHSCCFNPIFVVVDKEDKACCDGYYGAECDRPKCTTACPAGQSCVAPNTCGVLALCEKSCENDGSCVAIETCSCLAGYTGQYCETAIPSSACPRDCLNSGRCVNGVCQCTSGFTGSACETLLSP